MRYFYLLVLTLLFGCADTPTATPPPPAHPEAVTAAQNPPEQMLWQMAKFPIPVIFDTDANNELDDQHALAYLLYNRPVFQTLAITTNATKHGGNIEEHTLEAKRIMQLLEVDGAYPLIDGANQDFNTILPYVSDGAYDGHEAVEKIIQEGRIRRNQPLILAAVGKLTNVALALSQAPEIIPNVRVVWLGSNYPAPGEYNQENDEAALNYVLSTNVPFDMVTVRYGEPSGSDAVKIYQSEVKTRFQGKGQPVATPVMGRHGEAFQRFGDYSVNLFDHVEFYGNPPGRAMFDMVALAIVKNPDWGEVRTIPAPKLVNHEWVEQPDNPRTIQLWENFDREGILNDFYNYLDLHTPRK